MVSPQAPAPGPDFAEFFRAAYQPLVRDVIFAGWNLPEAEDAVSTAMAAVLQQWGKIENPRAYARRAAIRSAIKNKERGLQRIQERLIQRGDIPAEQEPDPGPMMWEQQEWVKLLLKSLPPAQREVLACMVDTFTRQEIAQLLGKTEAAVRQNLCAARRRLARCLAEMDDDPEAGTLGEEAG